MFEIHRVHNVLVDIAKDQFLKLGKEFTYSAKMEEELFRKYYYVDKLSQFQKPIMNSHKGRVKPFMKLESDLETSLGSSLTMGCLIMSLHKNFIMG